MTEEREARSLPGLPLPPVAGPEDLAGFDPETQLGRPGAYPFTRGAYPTMYRGRRWTMRQFAGFGSAGETKARHRVPLQAGQGGRLGLAGAERGGGLGARPPSRSRRTAASSTGDRGTSWDTHRG